jgi:hypothetical protein
MFDKLPKNWIKLTEVVQSYNHLLYPWERNQTFLTHQCSTTSSKLFDKTFYRLIWNRSFRSYTQVRYTKSRLIAAKPHLVIFTTFLRSSKWPMLERCFAFFSQLLRTGGQVFSRESFHGPWASKIFVTCESIVKILDDEEGGIKVAEVTVQRPRYSIWRLWTISKRGKDL